MTSRSLLAGVGTLLVLWSFNIGVVILHKHRELRIRGPRETLEVAIFVAGLASFGMLNTFDEPFLPCYGYMLWGLVPMVFVWPAFYLYITRYARLYHMHRMRAKSNSSAKSDATTITTKEDTPVRTNSSWQSFLNGAISFSTRITEKPRLRSRVRAWLLCFVILASCLLAMYAVHFQENDGADAPHIPNSYEDCRINHPLWYLCFSVMLIEGGFFLVFLFGTIIDIGREASSRGDSLGIKTMLQRMGLDAGLSMVTFCVLVFAHFAGNLEGRWIFLAFVPFIISFYLDLTLIPTIRAVIAIRLRRKLLKKNGLLDSDDLGKVMKIEDCKNPAELARMQNLVRLQAFIMTKEGYRTMHEHLAMEFGLESLLFVTEAANYAADFAHLDDIDEGDDARATRPKGKGSQSEQSQTNSSINVSSTLEEGDEDAQSVTTANAPTLNHEDDDDEDGASAISARSQVAGMQEQRISLTPSASNGGIGQFKVKRKRHKNSTLLPETALVPKVSVTKHNLQRKLRNPLQGMRKDKAAAPRLTPEEMTSRCIHIYFKFVHLNAPYQINIPANMLARFRGIGKTTKELRAERGSLADLETGSTTSSHNGEFEATPGIFNDLIIEVLSMVFRDSFQRYLDRSFNRKLWDKFDAVASEVEVLSEMSSQYNSQTSAAS